MKIKIMSDLHYNGGLNGVENDNFSESLLYKYFGHDLITNNCIVLLAGDITSGVQNHKRFLKSFFPNCKVIFIDGNHVCYEARKPILAHLKKELKSEFPKNDSQYTYLDNDWVWLDDSKKDIAVIGSTLYTDYEYSDLTLDEFNNHCKSYHLWQMAYGLTDKEFKPHKKLTKKLIREESLLTASLKLNDFLWGNEDVFKSLSPEYYLKLHKTAKKEIKRCHDEILSINANATIILMTHHCLSPRCIDEKYRKNIINSSYTSDLEKWVDEKLPNVKLVISGHVHNRCDFVFGERNIRYITNPCGYIPSEEHTMGIPFNPNFIVETNNL